MPPWCCSLAKGAPSGAENGANLPESPSSTSASDCNLNRESQDQKAVNKPKEIGPFGTSSYQVASDCQSGPAWIRTMNQGIMSLFYRLYHPEQGLSERQKTLIKT